MVKSKTFHSIAFFLIIALGFIVYANSLKNGFVYDDQLVVKHNTFLTSLSNIKYLFSQKYYAGAGEHSYRPLLTLSYFLDYHFWKDNPFGYHLTNVVLHILTGILLYLFLLCLVPLLDKKLNEKKFYYKIALLSSLFFIVHSVQTEAVNGVAFREESLFTLFLLASFVFYLKAKTLMGRKRFLFIAISLVSYQLSGACKESAALLLIIILLIDIFICSEKKQSISSYLSKNLPIYFLYITLTSIWIYIIHALVVNPNPALKFPLAVGSLYSNILTHSRILISYIRIFLFPLHLSAEYAVSFSHSLLEPKVLPSIFIIFFILFFILYSLRYSKIFLFSGLWISIPLGAHMLLPSKFSPMADRFLYFPSIGFCLFLSTVLIKTFYVKAKFVKPTVVFSIILLLSFYSARTILRNQIWKDGIIFWETRLRYPPLTARAHSSLGDAYYEKGLLDKAIRQYEKSIETNPKYADAHYNLANTYMERDLYDKAIQHYQETLKLKPFYDRAYVNLGNAYYKKGLLDKTVKQYLKALEINPFSEDASANLGTVYLEMGLIDKAKKYLKKTLEAESDSYWVWYNLGNSYSQKGLYDKAIENYQRAIQVNPLYDKAYNNLGSIYYKQGLIDKAIEQYQKTLKIKPDFVEARYNLGNSYFQKGLYDKAIENYQRAIRTNPNIAEIHYNLGIAYFKKGLYDKAEEAWKKALKINPNYSPASEALNSIHYERRYFQ